MMCKLFASQEGSIYIFFYITACKIFSIKEQVKDSSHMNEFLWET